MCVCVYIYIVGQPTAEKAARNRSEGHQPRAMQEGDESADQRRTHLHVHEGR